MTAQLLTARQVAELLGVHGNTVKRLVQRRQLEAYRIVERGDLRFFRRDVDAYLAARIAR